MNVSAANRSIDRLKKKRQAIHVARRQLDMDDASYRALLMRAAGVNSSADINTFDKADAVLEELSRLGAPSRKPKAQGNEWRFVFKLVGERQALAKKIYRVAQKIGATQTPPVELMSKAWVEGIVRQSSGLNAPSISGKVVKSLETCDAAELMRIIQILESRASKLGAH